MSVYVRNALVPTYGALTKAIVDQQFALKWVQKHVCTRAPSDVRMAERRFQINKFGGDPKRVTIWGQSSGVIAHGLLEGHD